MDAFCRNSGIETEVGLFENPSVHIDGNGGIYESERRNGSDACIDESGDLILRGESDILTPKLVLEIPCFYLDIALGRHQIKIPFRVKYDILASCSFHSGTLSQGFGLIAGMAFFVLDFLKINMEFQEDSEDILIVLAHGWGVD